MWAWWLAAVAGIVLTGAHWIAWRRAASAILPTARFVPVGARPVQVRRVAPDEPWLWLLRLLVVGCLGAAVAPGLVPLPRAARARVLVVDATRAVGSPGERTDSVSARLTDGARVEMMAFDLTPRTVAAGDLASLPRADVAGALDAALVAAARRATAWRARAREVEIVVVSPVVEEEWTPAIPAIVQAAGVPVHWVRLSPARDSTLGTTAAAAGTAPSAATPTGAAVLHAVSRVPANTRVIVGTAGADDSAFARQGGVVVSFAEPQDGGPVRALLAGDAGAIGPWGTAPAGEGTPVAWWDDGAVAATQVAVGRGCFRTVGVRLPVRGDDILRPSMAAVVRRLVEGCATSQLAPVPAAQLPMGAANMGAVDTRVDDPAQRRWWLAFAVVLLAVEWAVRRRREQAPA